jgi:hypothetical protein
MENRKFMIDGETFSNNELSTFGARKFDDDDDDDDDDDEIKSDDEIYQKGDDLNNLGYPAESYEREKSIKSTGLVTKRVKVIKKVTRKINTEDVESNFNNYKEDNNAIVEVNEEPEAMPQEYYHGVDSFLSKPAPKIKISKKNSKSETQIRPSINNDEINYGVRKGEGILPRIGGDKQPPKPPSSNKLGPTGIKSKVASIRSNKPVNTKSKTIDTNLLMQAFSYTEQIVREEILEEQQAMIADNYSNGQVSSAPNTRRPTNKYGENNPLMQQQPRSAPTGSKKQVAGKKGKGNGLVKKLRGGITADNTGFGVATIHESDSRRNALDFDSLVANFEQGVNLQKLQDELKQSKASIAKSENFMRELAREYSSGN